MNETDKQMEGVSAIRGYPFFVHLRANYYLLKL